MLCRSLVYAAMCGLAASVVAAPPQYQIFDMGVVQTGDTSSQGFRISTGGIGVGRSIRSGGAQAMTYTPGGGTVGLPNLSGRNYAVANSANDSGLVVGTAASTLFGSSRLPVYWQSGVVTQFTLPAGQTLGDANDVNASGTAVGSVNSGSGQLAAIYTTGGAGTIITNTTGNGSFFLTAFGIGNSGRIVGQGIDPNNAARNVGIVLDSNGNCFEVGALSGANGALAFDVSNDGRVTGSSMFNQGSGLPFIYTDGGGMVAVPLPVGTSQGSGRGVNTSGWVVGTASSAFAIPFVYDGTNTYRIGDVIVNPAGWDLLTNTSSSALGISDGGAIVGTGVFNGAVHGYYLAPVPEPATLAVLGLGLFAVRRRRSG